MLTRVSPHPNADREVAVEVDAGWGRLTVVTGGPHVEVGRKVAVALPGARVIDAEAAAPRLRKLKKGRIRGVMSEGMLCSAKELGISDDHSSIFLLAAHRPGARGVATRVRGCRFARGVSAPPQGVKKHAGECIVWCSGAREPAP
jgi:tRNA-binding EMAP/Myf-like protein